MYASLSPESVRWGLPPYDRAKVERLTSDLTNKITLLAVSVAKIVGHLLIFTFPSERTKGIGELLIYLHQDFQNAGLGAAMIREGIRMSKARGWHRIGLKVVQDNQRAFRLYEKMGFQKEGVIRDGYFGEDGKYHNEVEMGLLL
jgi:RimJ/RimL family protein N-acetyltransferase